METIGRRTALKGILGAGAGLAFLGRVRAGAAPPPDYIARYVHPELQPMARMFSQMSGNSSPLSSATLAAQRAGMSRWVRPRLADVPIERRQIPGHSGQPEVTIYVVNAKPGQSRPGLLDTHGGGYVMGNAEGDLADIQGICKTLDCGAVVVEYRLAPETTYAGSIEDNYAALKWLHDNAEIVGVDQRRLAVIGGSAGGGHAALLAITARDRGEVPLAFQCLIYPMLDDRTGTSHRVSPPAGQLVWTADSNRFGWRSFLGVEPGGATVPARAVPARVANLAGLPPAFIGVGAIDLFCDEDVAYAQRLNAAGVATELIVVPGAFHGFDMAPAPISAWFNAAKLDALRRGLGLPIGAAAS